jgi:hypothetical protein
MYVLSTIMLRIKYAIGIQCEKTNYQDVSALHVCMYVHKYVS